MNQFNVGDEVRVARLFNSPWQNVRGSIVEIVERRSHAGAECVQECAVSIAGSRRWFLAQHLAPAISDKFVRFFRAEVSDRWHLGPDDVAHLNGDPEQLIDFLCTFFCLSMRRAEAEVTEFYAAFNKRIAQASLSGHGRSGESAA